MKAAIWIIVIAAVGVVGLLIVVENRGTLSELQCNKPIALSKALQSSWRVDLACSAHDWLNACEHIPINRRSNIDVCAKSERMRQELGRDLNELNRELNNLMRSLEQ